ncbi:MAG: ATP-binding protein [Candidatus Electrothrix sp.]
MNAEHAQTISHAAFHGYELFWWGGICILLLFIIILLLRNRRKKKDVLQLRSFNAELSKDLQQQATTLATTLAVALAETKKTKALLHQLTEELSATQQTEKERTTELQQATERLRTARKFETIGLITGEIAHDLNNILSGVLHYPEQVLHNLPEDSPLRSPLLSLRHSGQQAVALVADLLSAAKAGSAVKEITDLNKLVQKTLEGKENQDFLAERPGISLRVRLCPDPIPVSCSPPHIRQCLHNLLLNGCDTVYTTGHVGTITVSLENRYVSVPSTVSQDSPPGEYAVLSVADTGPSMSPLDRTRIFEPFYSKKVLKRNGSGLTLAMLRNIMEEHNGWVDLPTESQGNRFDLYFPIKPVQIYSPGESNKKELSGQGQRILIIDKKQQERTSEFLTEIGYRVISVPDSTGAISYLNKNTVDLVILDLMEDEFIEGAAIYEQILFLHPSQKTLLIGTSPDCKPVKAVQAIQAVQQRGAATLLQAPFTQEQLQQAVGEGLL